MIDERQEELASLYALDLLEEAERARFEAALARDPALQTLVRELREAAAALARTAPRAEPPAELKHRVLATIEARQAASLPAPEKNIVRPVAFGFWQFLPWAAAACFALAAGWFAQRQASSRSEAALVREHQALANVELQSVRNHLEAERIVSQRQITDLGQKMADATRQLREAREGNVASQRELRETELKLAVATRTLAEAQERSRSLERQLADSRTQIASLSRELQTQGDIANFKITTLASMLDNSPQALAVAVWNPAKQEGLLQVAGLPALGPNEDYQLWVVDPQYPDPVDGGVFTVEPGNGAARVPIKAKQPVRAIRAFAVTKERKGGVPKAEGAFVLLSK